MLDAIIFLVAAAMLFVGYGLGANGKPLEGVLAAGIGGGLLLGLAFVQLLREYLAQRLIRNKPAEKVQDEKTEGLSS